MDVYTAAAGGRVMVRSCQWLTAYQNPDGMCVRKRMWGYHNASDLPKYYVGLLQVSR